MSLRTFDATEDSGALFNKYLDEIKARGGLEITIADAVINPNDINIDADRDVDVSADVTGGAGHKKPMIVVVDRKQMSATTADPLLRKLFHQDVAETPNTLSNGRHKKKKMHITASTISRGEKRGVSDRGRFADIATQRYDGIGIADEVVGGTISDEINDAHISGILDEVETGSKYSEYLDTSGYDSEESDDISRSASDDDSDL